MNKILKYFLIVIGIIGTLIIGFLFFGSGEILSAFIVGFLYGGWLGGTYAWDNPKKETT